MKSRRLFLVCTSFFAVFVFVIVGREAHAQGATKPASPPSALSAESLAAMIVGPPPPAAPGGVARDAAGHVTIRAVRLEAPLALDGRLDEEVYAAVPPISDFVQQEPHAGEPATERTDVWIFFDEKTFYVSARCWDSHPERMVITELRRDSRDILENENFALVFDTFYDRRNGYAFQTNPLGAMRDQTVTNEGQPNPDWNTVWDVRSGRFNEGWVTEMAIPFKSLRYAGSGQQPWSINIRRIVRWKNETSYIVPISPVFSTSGIYKLSSAPTVVLETPPPSMNLELKPYAISSVISDRAAAVPFSNDLRGDAGLDLKYGITQSLTADLTFNTDFAQVEADEQQVNLTRFNLQFPEKRDFFLEGGGIFSFGGGGGNAPVLFFSRQIGVSSGRAVPIQAGGRVTGKAGRFDVGALNIQTGKDETVGARSTNFSVVRLKRDVLRRSYIGILGTRRSPSAGTARDNVALGVDARLAFFENVNLSSYYARTHTPGAVGDESSYRGHFDYGSDRYGLALEHLLVGDSFKPETGFVRRTDFRRSFASGRFSPRPRVSRIIRKFYAEGSLDYATDADGTTLETRELQGSFEIELENSDRWSIAHTRSYDFLDERFSIARGVVIPIGTYQFANVGSSYTMGRQRPVSGVLNVSRGTFYGGHRTDAGYTGQIQLTPGATIEPRLSWNWVDLPYGRFTARLVSTRASVAFSPRMAIGALIQYNSSNDAVDANVRFRWEYAPGSDFFVVYSEGRRTSLDAFPTLETRGLVVKLTRLVRF